MSERRKPRPRLNLVAVRLERDELARLDALRPVLSTPWHEATRSDVLRAAILAGLGEAEKSPPGPKSGDVDRVTS